ncbi:hypothetical protein IJ21_48130 [Paenibacillus sp. 32O-W]|uniref:DUF4367 domain-containing protein n=1 Tax=Paenibacillus sp. 32O-W TaxID=1695218 RepID=UPI000721F86F|nr:DUF4367 domain-containing protein [Paenibacillus sp. 32O-W]ALS30174.1 hypothetical protein IJ21_48130 [Paenibacillus sp. 32O-W]
MNETEKREHEELKKVVEMLYHDIDVPEPANWDSVRLKLQKNRRCRKWMNRLKISGTIAAVSMLLSLVFSGHVPSTYAQFSSFLSNVKSQFVAFFFDTQEKSSSKVGAKTIPPDDTDTELSASISETTTLEIAKDKLSFTPLIPAYMPAPYELDHVRIFRETGGSYDTIHLEYATSDDQVIILTEQAIDEHTSRIKTDVHEEAGTIKEIQIDGQHALWVELPDGFISIEWLTTDRIKIALSGQIPAEEILRIVNSLR